MISTPAAVLALSLGSSSGVRMVSWPAALADLLRLLPLWFFSCCRICLPGLLPRWSSSCCTAAALGFFPDGLSSRSPRWTARLPGVAVLRLCGLLPDLPPVPCWLLLPGQIFSSCCTPRDLLRMDGAPSPPASLDGSAVSLRSAARTPPQSFHQGSADGLQLVPVLSCAIVWTHGRGSARTWPRSHGAALPE